MESPSASRITALKALGQVSEIAAFTERKEITQVKQSDDIKAQLLAMIQGAMHDNARTITHEDDQDVAALLAEISTPAAIDPAAVAGLFAEAFDSLSGEIQHAETSRHLHRGNEG